MKRFLAWLLGFGLALSGLLATFSMSLAEEGEWLEKAGMPFPRLFFSVSAAGELVYVIGGTLAEPIARVDTYDPSTDTWAQKADMPSARAGIATSVVDGKVYAIGGWSNEAPALSTVEEYDPATNTWTRKTDMPTPRVFFTTAAVKGKSMPLVASRQTSVRCSRLSKYTIQRLTSGHGTLTCQILGQERQPRLWVGKSICLAVCLTCKDQCLRPSKNTTL